MVSEDHRLAMNGCDPLQKNVVEGVAEAEKAKRKSVEVALKSAYWIVLEEVANRKYKSLLNFLRHLQNQDAQFLRKGANATYDSPDILISC